MGGWMRMLRSYLVSILIVSILLLSLLTSIQYGATGDNAAKASPEALFSSSNTVYSGSSIKYVDSDIAKGKNYFYAYADTYNLLGSYVYVKRSSDGITWPDTVNLYSGMASPHGGFCVYTVSGTDNVIASAQGYAKKSSNDGSTYSELADLPAEIDYAAVATNSSLDPSRPYDNNIYIAGNIRTQTNGIFLTRSLNDGASWSSLYTITSSTNALCPVLARDSSKLYCFYGITYGDVYVANSTDWGKTWSSGTKIYTHTPTFTEAFPGHAQYMDESRCLLTISDYTSPYPTCKGIYGYFWYGNKTFQQIGNETGSSYNNPDVDSYSGISFSDALGVNYTSIWCYYSDASTYRIEAHYSHDSNITIIPPLKPKLICNSPQTIASLGTSYAFNASATLPDSGSSSWVLTTNASWLSIKWSNNTNCLLSGIPTRGGTFWVNIEVSDVNSSDHLNWTISVNPWYPPVTIYSSSDVRFCDGDLAKGANYLYAFSDQYDPSAGVYVKRSTNGSIWSAGTTIWSGMGYPVGGFCVFTVGSRDYIIASALGNVKMSTDNASSFSSLTAIGSAFDYTAVATNASMDPSKSYDNNIYVAGNLGVNGIYLRKSVDGGTTWSSAYTISSTQTICPLLVRDSTKLYCLYRYDEGSEYNIYVKNSTDWGKTWGSQTKVYTKTQFCAVPCHAQLIDSQRCLLTISDAASPTFSNSRGVFGYFWFKNNTFQQIGYETGSVYNNPDGHTYAGILFTDSIGINYTSLWCYCVDSSNYVIKIHYTHDLPFNMTPIPQFMPEITSDYPPTNGSLYVEYSYNASATLPDNGASSWSLSTNASWLSILWSNETHCLVSGSPIDKGTYWVSLQVSDANSSDYLNWTIATSLWIPPAPAGPFLLSLSPTNHAYLGLDYSFNFSASKPDNGPSSWSLTTNTTWLSIVWSNETHCLVGGTPINYTPIWADLTLSDSNSSDHVYWSITILSSGLPILIPHSPIHIQGNSGFTNVSGVTTGSGTSADPYVISYWDIGAVAEDGIFIEDTTAHFVIKDCFFHDGGTSNMGIILANCSNGLLFNNSCLNDYVGIALMNSSYIVISNNSCNSNNGYGIFLMLSSGNNLLTGNNCSYNLDSGIALFACSNNTIDSNICSHSVLLDGMDICLLSNDNLISRNDCSSNNLYGISILLSSQNNLLFWNTIYGNNGYGVAILSVNSTGNWIFGNNFIGNAGTGIVFDPSKVQAYDDATFNWWNSSAGYGNYWSDMPGPDAAAPFGIVERLYQIAGNARATDPYPLSAPFGTPDIYAPMTTSSLKGTLGNKGWYKSSVTLNLTAYDWYSVVNGTWYRLGTSGDWQEYSSDVTFSADGEIIVQFYSMDDAGNNETMGNITIRIDTKGPTTTSNISGLKITLTSVDNASGSFRTYYRIDDGTWMNYTGPISMNNSAKHIIEFYSVDIAGNNESIQSIEVGGSGFFGLDIIWWIIIIAAVLATVLILIFLFTRKGEDKDDDYPQLEPPPLEEPPKEVPQFPAPVIATPTPLVTPQPASPPAAIFCTSCGAPMKADWLFCKKCGAEHK